VDPHRRARPSGLLGRIEDDSDLDVAVLFVFLREARPTARLPPLENIHDTNTAVRTA